MFNNRFMSGDVAGGGTDYARYFDGQRRQMPVLPELARKPVRAPSPRMLSVGPRPMMGQRPGARMGGQMGFQQFASIYGPPGADANELWTQYQNYQAGLPYGMQQKQMGVIRQAPMTAAQKFYQDYADRPLMTGQTDIVAQSQAWNNRFRGTASPALGF